MFLNECFPILNFKLVVMVPTGRIILWKLEVESYSFLLMSILSILVICDVNSLYFRDRYGCLGKPQIFT
jgi:hypothetical protein